MSGAERSGGATGPEFAATGFEWAVKSGLIQRAVAHNLEGSKWRMAKLIMREFAAQVKLILDGTPRRIGCSAVGR